MSFIFGSIVLPNPDRGNTRAHGFKVEHHLTMSGTSRTYIRRTTDEVLVYDFSNIMIDKIEEVALFITENIGETIRIIDHRNKIFHVNLTDNTNTFTINKRAKGCGMKESGSFTLTLRSHLP